MCVAQKRIGNTDLYCATFLLLLLFFLLFLQVKQDSVEVEVARCTRGEYFGELALVTNKPRAASVYAVGATKCLGDFHK